MMDPELIKQRQAFQKRALAQPAVSHKANIKRKETKATAKEPKAKKQKRVSKETGEGDDGPRSSQFNYKVAKASMASEFGMLARIVDHMKKRHLEQSTWGLDLHEILDEIQVFDLNNRTKEWLTVEALPNNPKITRDAEGKFIYNPPLKIKGKKSLIDMIKASTEEGRGGILMSDLSDSIANAEKVIQSLGDQVKTLPATLSKRRDKAVFFNDAETVLNVDEDFKALFRTIKVDHLDEPKIEEYLQRHGISSMKDTLPKFKPGMGQAPKRKQVRRKNVIVHNEHLEGILQDFSTD